jgi:hypothetical protein
MGIFSAHYVMPWAIIFGFQESIGGVLTVLSRDDPQGKNITLCRK